VTEDVTKRQEDLRTLLEASRSLVLDDPALSAQALEQLQKRCLESSESLMRDMLTLDSLVAATPEEKAKRKEQVTAIQSILDSLDDVSEKLRSLAQGMRQKQAEVVREKAETLAKAQERAGEVVARAATAANHPDAAAAFAQKRKEWDARKAEADRQRQESARKLEAKLEHIAGLLLDDAAWKTLRLKPRLEVEEQPSAYLLKGYLPGMRDEDVAVDVTEDDTELIVRGARIPTREEAAGLMRQLGAAVREGRLDARSLLPLSDEQLLLQMGSGRYGSFVERFRLPDDAAGDRVAAEYDRGVLKVFIPRRPLSFGRVFPAPAPRPSPLAGFDSLFW